MVLDKKYHSITFKLFRNYYFELQLLYKVRAFRDGVSVFGLWVNFDFYEIKKWDHTPRAEIGLILFNITSHMLIYKGEHNGEGQTEGRQEGKEEG
jgi:hypothetical protein